MAKQHYTNKHLNKNIDDANKVQLWAENFSSLCPWFCSMMAECPPRVNPGTLIAFWKLLAR